MRGAPVHRTFATVLATLLLIAPAGCSGVAPASKPPAPAIKAEQIWARPSGNMAAMQTGGSMGMHGKEAKSGAMGAMAEAMKGPTSAIYMLLSNSGKETDSLVAVKAEVSEKVELHQTSITNDVMRMEPVEKIEIPAGGQVELKKGGLHVMLLGVKKELKAGDKFMATLVFSKAGEIPVEVEVKDP